MSQWDGFPAWGVGQAVVRSEQSPEKGDLPASTFKGKGAEGKMKYKQVVKDTPPKKSLKNKCQVKLSTTFLIHVLVSQSSWKQHAKSQNRKTIKMT